MRELWWSGLETSASRFEFEVDAGPARSHLRQALFVVDGGVAVQDLSRVACQFRTVIGYPSAAAESLLMAAKCDWFPAGCTVQDLIGWMLLGADTGGRVADSAALAKEWADVGLGAHGWLFAAAGYCPAEARTALDTGIVDQAKARFMAALRGAPLPVE